MSSPSDISTVTNLIPTPNEGFTTTVAAPGATSAGTTVPLASVTGLTNGTVFVGIVEPGLTNEQTFTGTVDTAGSQITGVKWTRGSNVAHAAGVTVVDYVSGTAFKMLARAVAVSLDQDGTLKAGAVDNAAALASDVVTTAKILNANVTTAKIADANVTTAKLADASVTNAKLSTTAGEIGGASQAWTPTVVGFSSNPTSSVYRYLQVGKQVTLWIWQGADGTSNANNLTLTLPVTAATISGMHWSVVCRVVDNGIVLSGAADIVSAGTTITFAKDVAGNVFTTSGAKRVLACIITYEAA